MQRLVNVLLCVAAACWGISCAEEDEHAYGTSGVMLVDLGRTESVVSDARQMRRYLTEEGPDAPLYRGFGTHFVYVYVGTPRQRVSVIVDTGSHHTAFPCSGCNQCGDHTDLYFNPKQSSTIEVPKCGGKNCVFSQSYTEGSMWTAYRVKDRFFIGGETTTMAAGAEKHDVEFTFGCQTKETGLFRTQMENGIMGLSADAKTLPNTLYHANRTSTNAFALCFLTTGGVMSLGGTHPLLKQGPMGYAQMTKKSGYFTVKVLSMFLRKASSTELTELKMPMTKLNSGKGVIVDSGTTDTYLPSAISSAFQSLFKKLCGISYTRSTFALSEEELKRLPTVVLHLQKWHRSGQSSEYVQVEMPPTRYLEQSNKAGKGGKPLYVFRLYLTERSGGVLGANFMTGQNVEFDQKQQRVGFAPSHCKASSGEPLYPGITKPVKLKKHLRKLGERDIQEENGKGFLSIESTEEEEGFSEAEKRRQAAAPPAAALLASGPCSAQCSGRTKEGDNNTFTPVRIAAGYMPASPSASAVLEGSKEGKSYVLKGGKIPCSIACDAATGEQLRLVVPAEDEEEKCPIRPWGQCDANCMQTRLPKKSDGVINADVNLSSRNRSSSGSQAVVPPSSSCLAAQSASRPCWRELCPFRPALQCALRLKLSLPPFKAKKWNALWKEDVITAVAQTLKVDPAKVDIPEPVQKEEDAIFVIVHIRSTKVKMKGKTGPLVCPKLFDLLSPVETEAEAGAVAVTGVDNLDALRDGFVDNLHGLNSKICGSWDWVRRDNTLLAEESPGRGVHYANRLGAHDDTDTE